MNSSDIHKSAARGFEAAPGEYERGRAGYPADAMAALIAALGISSDSVVLDLGAGTGKLTRALLPTGARLIAVEPVSSMRAAFRALAPTIEVLDGRAEAIPLEDQSVSAVICAQAFHWFDGPAALKEIHRVLKPEGRLGLIWNVRDESHHWVAQLTRIMDPHAGDTPRYRTGQWREAFTRTKFFDPLQAANFVHEHEMTAESALERMTSISFIAALPPEAKQQVSKATQKVIQDHLQQAQADAVQFPYRVDMFWCQKRAMEENN